MAKGRLSGARTEWEKATILKEENKQAVSRERAVIGIISDAQRSM